MTTLLQVNASLSPLGQSDQLADRFVAAWHASHPDAQVSVRDLSAQPLAHLSADEVGAFFTPADARSAEQQALVAVSDALVAELRAQPGVQSVAAFGSRLHVAGQDAALLQHAVAPLAGRAGLSVALAEADLEDVFISLIGQAQDNFGGGAQPS